jgi:ribose-phosphate pyrophosphokinase
MKFPWDNEKIENMKYEIKSYPDGSKYVELLQWEKHLVYKINHYEDLWILNQINDILKHKNLECILIIPNLLDAQADRRFADNQPHSLKLVCEFLNSLKQFAQIEIFHPHNQEVVEALIDRVKIIDNHDFIYEVLAELKNEYYDNNAYDMEEKLVLMSSDAGGFKPLMKLVDKLEWRGETFSASKSRTYSEENGTKLVQQVNRLDFRGKDILIVDDICIGGGTFKGLSKILKDKNCGKLYLAISHLTVNDLGNDPVTNYFDKVFTTNSKFEADRYHSWDFDIHKNLKVLELW